MWIYVLVFLVLIYVWIKERQQYGCSGMPCVTDCDNADGKVVKGTTPEPDDTNAELFDKIDFAADFSTRRVVWREAFILGFLGTVVIWYFLFRRFPTEFELVVSIVIFAAIVYVSYNFNKFHMVDYISQNIQDSVSMLRERFNVS